MNNPVPISPDERGHWVTGTVAMGPEILDRMERSVAMVRERLLRCTTALQNARIDYAVIGGNAAAWWVSTVDKSAVRNARNVEILVRREDFKSIAAAFEHAGFLPASNEAAVVFCDGLTGKPRDGIHLTFCGEHIRPNHIWPAPEIITVSDATGFKVLRLELLLQLLLIRDRSEDKMLARDLIDVGLVDQSWPARFPGELAARLQHLLDTPDD